MEYFFIYKNEKTNLNLFFDVRYIDFVSLIQIESEIVSYEDEDIEENINNNDEQDNLTIKRIYRRKRRIPKNTSIINLLLKIHFKNTNYHQKLVFDKDDKEAYIIYNSLTEAINKNPQMV